MAVASGGESLAATLDRLTAEGELYERLDNRRVRCFACGHRCVILEGLRGICKVRFNQEGMLLAPRGYVAGLQADPVEKKPFFHVLPGSVALTFGMLGCDFHCPYCQNWLTSQALRDGDAGTAPRLTSAREIARLAESSDARVVASSYNEPLITSEWAREVFAEIRRDGRATAFVSNGNATREALEYLRPFTDAYKIDLKSMSSARYRKLGGRLEHVLDAVQMVHDMGFWLEIVTLVVPGWNDSDAELAAAARFIAGVSLDVPWHVTAFHRDYRMLDPNDTTAAHLVRAAAIGREAGLRYVYAGNLPGRVGELEDTLCPGCGHALIRRRGYRILANELTVAGACPKCGTAIPGLWSVDSLESWRRIALTQA